MSVCLCVTYALCARATLRILLRPAVLLQTLCLQRVRLCDAHRLIAMVSSLCSVCLDEVASHVCVPCGHVSNAISSATTEPVGPHVVCHTCFPQLLCILECSFRRVFCGQQMSAHAVSVSRLCSGAAPSAVRHVRSRNRHEQMKSQCVNNSTGHLRPA